MFIFPPREVEQRDDPAAVYDSLFGINPGMRADMTARDAQEQKRKFLYTQLAAGGAKPEALVTAGLGDLLYQNTGQAPMNLGGTWMDRGEAGVRMGVPTAGGESNALRDFLTRQSMEQSDIAGVGQMKAQAAREGFPQENYIAKAVRELAPEEARTKAGVYEREGYPATGVQPKQVFEGQVKGAELQSKEKIAAGEEATKRQAIAAGEETRRAEAKKTMGEASLAEAKAKQETKRFILDNLQKMYAVSMNDEERRFLLNQIQRVNNSPEFMTKEEAAQKAKVTGEAEAKKKADVMQTDVERLPLPHTVQNLTVARDKQTGAGFILKNGAWQRLTPAQLQQELQRRQKFTGADWMQMNTGGI